MAKLHIIRRKSARDTRETRTRAKIKTVAIRPRLTVFRSNKFIYVQLIDDSKGKTLAGIGGKSPEAVAKLISERAVKLGIKEVVFDRGCYKYHGKVKLLAETCRASGLKF
jgi:large subunit ribosomal protein L18